MKNLRGAIEEQDWRLAAHMLVYSAIRLKKEDGKKRSTCRKPRRG